ncbi:t-SNARE VTI1 [Malassezia obtusa]|uniref:t-SNARE VTI1 n=1 Tax=Malassezia obtusa TaxID=76774 RepID=A0AAF0IRN4_9BASI|nr:t-SNARE VTI1 [Malassezia obtusa]
MAELFESYASDFAQLVQSVEERLVADFSKLSASARRSAIQNAEAEAEEAHDLLVQMEIEVQSFPQSVRERYSGNLRDLKGQHEQLRRKLKLHQQPHGGSGLPMDSYTDGDEEASGDSAPSQRQRLLQGTSLLEQGNERLAASTRLALETEDIGANILQDLRGQREQIEHSRDTQKIVTGAIIVVLVLLILLILYSKLF